MEKNFLSVEVIDENILNPVVRLAVHRENFNILEWHMSRLSGGVGNPVSVGLYRFKGTGQTHDERLAWSIVLKIIQSPANIGMDNIGEGDDQSHWNYWKREPLIYQSGLLASLPGSIVAPECFGVFELPGNVIWLWLEDITDILNGVWPLELYALTARHLGQLNGMYLSEYPLPTYPWLSRNRIRQWITTWPWRTINWEHPQVLKHYPKPENNPFKRLLAENARFLAKLGQLPCTFCHGDTYPTNFMTRNLPSGRKQTVALDWALASIAPLGEDLGQFIFGAQMNLKETNQLLIFDTLFENYIDGLRDSGYHCDPVQVRFGCVASAAYQVGLFSIILLVNALEKNGNEMEQGIEQTSTTNYFEVNMANAAYELIDLIR